MLGNASRPAVYGVTLLCVFTVARIVPLSAQSATADPAVLQAILIEVRQLRIAVENAASVTPRIQVAGQRVQQLEQTVADLKLKLGEARGYSRATQSSESANYGDANQQARAIAREGEIAASLSAAEAELADTKKILSTLLALPDATGKAR
jgi:hypothetical protein